MASNNLSQNIVYFISIGLLVYLFWLIMKFRKMLYVSNKTSFFSEKNAIISQNLGTGLIYYCILKFFLEVISNSIDEFSGLRVFGENLGERLLTALFERIPLLLIALFILIIAQLIKEGYTLKQENDLTI